MPRERRDREADKGKDREVGTASETAANRLTFSVSDLRDERCTSLSSSCAVCILRK